ncbi:eukaryotic rRNA processing protein EBP2-domain-containing protein [Amylocarpus encephaloides]|uniref:Eukaryotic rRNA processing protein EBP2-domain-containing protein n=1 Tax=Amylocarpus encephaloides TaxID=45428 RepID=A0A9P8C3D1_9HELO|nr:eukaryotic rRNA processing protein EBP2-domain-containing protein [Amylocarpus encephaloides]
MVNKGKLKMALAADKGIDYKELNLKKKGKMANKTKTKTSLDKSKTNGKVVEGEWEDVDKDSEAEDGSDDNAVNVDPDGEESNSEDEAIDFAALDESDSDSSAGENDQDNSASEEEDNEDIPISDLEDLSDDEKEDIIPHQRLTINNTNALTTALKRIALPTSKMEFSEHQSITTAEPVAIEDVSDDLKRELAFYAQSLSAAQEGRKLLKQEGVACTRPNDYFAEMVKADEHMAKIKAKLIEEAAGKKASAEARKQRDLKKFGKQVQVAKLQERDKERKQTLDKIKVLKRKRQGEGTTTTNEADMFDVALEDETSKPNSRKDRVGPNKRRKKDEKYGHGGKKRFSKSGDAMSTGDMKGFSSKKMKGGAAKRPGKARRAGTR